MVYTKCSNMLCSLSILNKFITINGCHKTLYYVWHKILNLIEINFNNNYIIHHHTIQIVEKKVKEVQYLLCLPL